MKNVLTMALGLALVSTFPVLAQDAATGTQPASQRVPGGQGIAESFAVMTIKAIDQKSREVTLQLSDGRIIEFVAGDEVRNLDQVKPGQLVVVHYRLGMFVSLTPGGTAADDNQSATVMGRAMKGALPAGVASKVVDVTGTVMAVDKGAHTVTLKGPNRTVTLPVSMDIPLDNLKPGDQVNGKFSVSVAIRVEPAPDAVK